MIRWRFSLDAPAWTPRIIEGGLKRCNNCGRLHTASGWRTLAFVGVQDDYDGGFLELRNCPCGSTLCRPALGATLPCHHGEDGAARDPAICSACVAEGDR